MEPETGIPIIWVVFLIVGILGLQWMKIYNIRRKIEQLEADRNYYRRMFNGVVDRATEAESKLRQISRAIQDDK